MTSKYIAIATTAREYRVKSVIICALLMILVLTALGLTVYNIIKLKFLFVIGYLIGIALAVAYVLMRFNMTFATKISADRNNLFLTAWENMLVPYATNSKFKLIREFIPAKTKVVKIPIADIREIYIGTRSYISRSAAKEGFNELMTELIPAADLKRLSKSDLFCVYTSMGFFVMSIDNFDTRALSKVVANLLRVNENTELHTSSKKYRVYLKR